VLKIFSVFALFVWFKFSWQGARWLAGGIMEEMIKRVSLDTHYAAFGVKRSASMADYVLPPAFHLALFLALLWIGAYFINEYYKYLGVSL
jgi:hypothetical protein